MMEPITPAEAELLDRILAGDDIPQSHEVKTIADAIDVITDALWITAETITECIREWAETEKAKAEWTAYQKLAEALRKAMESPAEIQMELMEEAADAADLRIITKPRPRPRRDGPKSFRPAHWLRYFPVGFT